jgi:hypothetical protein
MASEATALTSQPTKPDFYRSSFPTPDWGSAHYAEKCGRHTLSQNIIFVPKQNMILSGTKADLTGLAGNNLLAINTHIDANGADNKQRATYPKWQKRYFKESSSPCLK